MRFWFLKKTLPKNLFFVFGLWFIFKNNRRTNVLLVGIFENAQKSYSPSKTPFWLFLEVNNGCLCVFKNTDQNNICASIKLNQRKIWTKIFFYAFHFKTQKCLFGGVIQFFFLIFLVFDIRHTNVILINNFENAQKNRH